MNIIELAREAGLPIGSKVVDFVKTEPCVTVEIERFAALVRAQALEEAAAVAVDSVAFCGGTVETEAYVRTTIRQLKEKI